MALVSAAPLPSQAQFWGSHIIPAAPAWQVGSDFAINFASGPSGQCYIPGVGYVPLSYIFSCTRAQTVPSYVTNADGTLTSCLSNSIRIGVGVGILIEESRTNLALSSGDQTNAAWTTLTSGAGTISVTGGSPVLAPDGVGSPALVTINRSALTDDAQLLQTFTGTAAAYSGGFYIMANADSEIGKQLTVGLFNGTNYTSSLVILTGGWQRVYQSATLAASASCAMFIGYRNGDTASTGSVAFLTCCAQAELGAGISSYIPTTNALVTRNADVIPINGLLLSLLQNATALTQFARVINVESTVGGGRIGATFNTGSGSAMCFINSSNAIAGFNHTTVFTPVALGGLTQFVGYPVNTVSSFSPSGISLVANGGIESTQALTMPTVTSAFLGSAGGASSFLNGYLQRLIFWNSQLGSTQRIALSQTYNTISATVGGQATNYYVPTELQPVSPVLVQYCHGAGEDQNAWTTDALKRPIREALLAQGYILSGSIAAGENWGNQAGLDSYTSQVTDAQARFGIQKLLIFSQSMGGLAGLLNVGNASFPAGMLKGIYLIYPACNLSWCYNDNASFKPEITTAYNIASDGSNYAAQTAGHDPVLLSGSAFTGIRMRFTSSFADMTVNKTANALQMQALVAAYATESDLLNTIGPHGDPSNFMPPANFIPLDMVKFFNRCLS